MKTQNAPFSLRVIYWLTNFSLVILLLASLAAVAFNIALLFNVFGNDLQLHTQFPVKVDFLETGLLTINNSQHDVELVNASTQIHFINTPVFIAQRVGLFLLAVLGITWYLLFIFRRFLKNVKEGNTFTVDNIKILKHIAYGLAGMWLFTLIYLRLFYYFVATNVSFEHIKVSNEFIDIDSVLIGAIFIWILAHIFETGLKLQQEKDLTI